MKKQQNMQCVTGLFTVPLCADLVFKRSVTVAAEIGWHWWHLGLLTCRQPILDSSQPGQHLLRHCLAPLQQVVLQHTHTCPFNVPLSGTIQVSRYQKGKTNLDFTEARDSEWQWHQLGHMQVCTSLQTDNHASTHHSVFYRLDAPSAAKPTASKHSRQSKHWRQQQWNTTQSESFWWAVWEEVKLT